MTVKINVEKALSDCRRFIVEQFFMYMLDRSPSTEELSYCLASEDPLELTCMNVVAASLDKALEAEKRLPITLAMFVKNAANSIHLPIQSVKHIVREIVVVDTGSVDGTVETAKKLGARVYQVPFTDFGSIRTLTAHLARQPWVLMLDSDEVLDPSGLPLLETLVSDASVDAWGLPRRRWADLEMTKQEELEAYPDWQYRLFRNKPTIVYKNRVHEVLRGADVVKTSAAGPHIEHLQSVFKKGDILKRRNELYHSLYDIDLKDGVVHKGPAVVPLDEVSDA